MRSVHLVCAAVGALILAAPLPAPGGDATSDRRAVILVTGEISGAIEPCGCTSDPLGDIARLGGILRRANKGAASGVLLLDAGNFSYPAGDVPLRKREVVDLRADFLARTFARFPFGGMALGEFDLARGAARIKPKRLAANLGPAPFVESSRVRDIGGIKIGIMGLVDPPVARLAGLTAEDPIVAARREAEHLRKNGAEVVIALLPLDRPRARQVARQATIDFVVLGKGVGNGLDRPEPVGDGFIVAPAAELQRIGRLEVVMRDRNRAHSPTPLIDAGSAESTAARRDEIGRRLEDLEARLLTWQKDRAAAAGFLQGKIAERDMLRHERASLDAHGWQPPARGSYFTYRLIPMRRVLPRDPGIGAAMRTLDKAIGAVNRRVAEPPPAAEPGRAAYVGDAGCAGCHKRQMAFWRTTVHARAWKTLVDGGKHADDDCVSCHVTGFGEIGGSSLGFTRRFENVQCETCHGPGSIHVRAEGLEEPAAVRLQTPESTCTRCHNEKHSDTFQYDAYMRDMLGPGHGGPAREKLGAGPTGHELRTKALARAKAAAAAMLKNEF